MTTVYHYTSPQGIYSILANKSLWFTDCQYLNDKSENKLLEDGKRKYILCASSNADTVAMWNYYVKNNAYQGYNLGINVEGLTASIKNDIKNPEIILEHGIVNYCPNPSKANLFSKHSAFSSEQEYRFVLSVPERCRFTGMNNLSLKYRIGDSGIITPYIEWNFRIENKKRLFTEITLAPMIEEELAQESFKRFLRSDVFENINIVSSSLKMRF